MLGSWSTDPISYSQMDSEARLHLPAVMGSGFFHLEMEPSGLWVIYLLMHRCTVLTSLVTTALICFCAAQGRNCFALMNGIDIMRSMESKTV